MSEALFTCTPPWRVHAAAQAASHIEAPIERVWALLCDVDHWPRWHPAVTRARADRVLTPGARFAWKSGGMAIESTVEHVLPGRRLVWSGRALGTWAWHTWDLEAHAGGVRVVTTESFGGWLPRLVPGPMATLLNRALHDWLAHLAHAAQAPAPISPHSR